MIAGQAPSPKHSPTAYSAQDDQLSVAVPACSDCPVRRIAAIPVRDRPAWRAAPGITAELDAVQCLPRGCAAAGAPYWRAGKPTPCPSGTGLGGCLRGGCRYPSPGGLRPSAAPDFSPSPCLRADGATCASWRSSSLAALSPQRAAMGAEAELFRADPSQPGLRIGGGSARSGKQVIFRVADRNQRWGGRCELLC